MEMEKENNVQTLNKTTISKFKMKIKAMHKPPIEPPPIYKRYFQKENMNKQKIKHLKSQQHESITSLQASKLLHFPKLSVEPPIFKRYFKKENGNINGNILCNCTNTPIYNRYFQKEIININGNRNSNMRV